MLFIYMHAAGWDYGNDGHRARGEVTCRYSFVRTHQATHRRGCILPYVKLLVFSAMGEQAPCAPCETKGSTIPPSLGFWFSEGRSENHCESGGDSKQLEEGEGDLQ